MTSIFIVKVPNNSKLVRLGPKLVTRGFKITGVSLS
jgi:hypothetical protein